LEDISLEAITLDTEVVTDFVTEKKLVAQFVVGKNWVRLIFVTAGLWPTIVTTVALLVNFIAIAKVSTRAIPFGSMVALVSIWLFCVFPLCLVGVILGRNWAGNPDFPCRVNPIPRPIPDKAWYAEPPMIILLSMSNIWNR
jgi:transmembrane 9 superfamily protein 3